MKGFAPLIAIIASALAIFTAVGTWAVAGYQAKDTTQEFRVHCANQTKMENDLATVLSELKTEVRVMKEQNNRIEQKLDRIR